MGVRIGANNGLNFANAIAGGVQNFLTAYNQRQAQNSQLALKMQEMQAESELRKMQMEKIKQEIAPVQFDMQKLSVMKKAMDGGVLPESVYNKQVSNVVQNVDTPAKLDAVHQAVNNFVGQKNASMAPMAFAPGQAPDSSHPQSSPTSFSLTPKEADFYGKMIGSQNQYQVGMGRLDVMQKQNDLNYRLQQDRMLADLQKNSNDNATKKYIANLLNQNRIEIQKLKNDLGFGVQEMRSGANDPVAKSLAKQIEDAQKSVNKLIAPPSGFSTELPGDRAKALVAQRAELAKLQQKYKARTRFDYNAPTGAAPSQPLQAIDTTQVAPPAAQPQANARPKFERGPGVSADIAKLSDGSEFEIDGKVYVKQGNQAIPR